MIQDTPIDFATVPPELIPGSIKEMITLFGLTKTTQLYRALPKGAVLEITKKDGGEFYCHLAKSVGNVLADEFFAAYSGAVITIPYCHKIRLWARNEVIRRRAESLYREGWSVRLVAYLLGWEFGITSKTLHGINNMYGPARGSSLSATTSSNLDLASLEGLANTAPPPVFIDLAKVPDDKLPASAWLIIERLGVEDATVIINRIPGVSEELAKYRCHEQLLRLLAGRVGSELAGRLLQAFAGEVLVIPSCYQARLWLIEQAISSTLREPGGCLDEHAPLHLAVSHGVSIRTVKRIIKKIMTSG